ncbi:hypothetical protein [Moritella viscosa]|uniref:hypothetical protein n=1 Tax=Moritella viscosa TaxID=80854 RepID=UPI00091D540C|nr:hypothetical protein [Moritella viscosa]SGZ17748.1 Ribosomal RNA large subunit methyltransferase F-23S rRNA mA1618 methyltransferase-rRNA adenine N-6-methyltransferase [Moritella viscosa]SHO28310.1 Ribosomal RNA large subunit methyltransferase F-23S rRNA mA1618 methyltransferase-rRNA adenine N-6-methyltransferase [Moritella viscosa]
MHIELIMYICSFIFAILGVAVASWSFIDTYRIRSAEEFYQARKNKIEASNRRHQEKTRL